MSSVNFKLAANFFAYGALIGISGYQTFAAGIIAYRALPINMFGALQHKTFPVYFGLQAALSLIVLATIPFKSDNTYERVTMAFNLVSSLFNLFVIVPKTTKIKRSRDQQMEIEGKSYKDPDVSDTMKALNEDFKKLHGRSMLANFGLIISTLVYGIMFVSQISVN